MADTEQKEQSDSKEQTDGSNGSGDSTRKTVARAAAVAAATGATALAARKVLDRNAGNKEQGGGKSSGSQGGGDASLITTIAGSAWDSARGTLVPMIEDAAEHAGTYLANNAPDVVLESVVPQFIRGFERAQKSSSQGDDDE